MTAHISPRLEREAQRLGILPPDLEPLPRHVTAPHPVEPLKLRTAVVAQVAGGFILWWALLYVAFSI